MTTRKHVSSVVTVNGQVFMIGRCPVLRFLGDRVGRGGTGTSSPAPLSASTNRPRRCRSSGVVNNPRGWGHLSTRSGGQPPTYIHFYILHSENISTATNRRARLRGTLISQLLYIIQPFKASTFNHRRRSCPSISIPLFSSSNNYFTPAHGEHLPVGHE